MDASSEASGWTKDKGIKLLDYNGSCTPCTRQSGISLANHLKGGPGFLHPGAGRRTGGLTSLLIGSLATSAHSADTPTYLPLDGGAGQIVDRKRDTGTGSEGSERGGSVVREVKAGAAERRRDIPPVSAGEHPGGVSVPISPPRASGMARCLRDGDEPDEKLEIRNPGSYPFCEGLAYISPRAARAGFAPYHTASYQPRSVSAGELEPGALNSGYYAGR
ncbi:hypothetical protein C8R43DRAFT_966218 [Mycena crocata]|nr:hypothetical protein C8R43DRAFT_966218 [Mycena crocata]